MKRSSGYPGAVLADLVSALLLSAPVLVAAQPLTDLVPRDAVWAYKDDGSDQGTAWRGVDFDDSAWARGQAELGYGDGDEKTPVGFGMDEANKFITTYFRHVFEIDDPARYQSLKKLALGTVCDDGCVVYMNGAEVARLNVPFGELNFRARALLPEDPMLLFEEGPDGVAIPSNDPMAKGYENVFQPGSVDAALLRKGRNVIAVEVHQATPDSPDIGFNLQLSARAPEALISKPAAYYAMTLQNLYMARERTPRTGTTWEEYLRWQDANRRVSAEMAVQLYDQYPKNEGRWEGLLALAAALDGRLPLIKGFGPEVEKKGADAIIPDTAAIARWDMKMQELTAAVLKAPDAPLETKEVMDYHALRMDFRFISEAASAADWNKLDLMKRFDAHASKYAGVSSEWLAARAEAFLERWDKASPGAATAGWQYLLNSGNPGLRQQARMKLGLPIDLKFTAADGREVDLEKMRGKVILIDFWATWCGPCIEQMPHIRKMHDKYGSTGLEVVGVAFENGSSAKALLKFAADKKLPWPHYYDGQGLNSAYAKKYGVSEIPQVWLIDKEGKVASTNAAIEGPEELERLVKQCLDQVVEPGKEAGSAEARIDI